MGFPFRNLTAATLAMGALAAFAGGANAQTPLVPGATVAPVPVTGGFGGTQLGTSSTGFFATGAGGNVISGTLLSSVFSGGAGSTGLDFYYQIIQDGAATTAVNSTNIVSFEGFDTAVSQSSTDTDAGGPVQTPSGNNFVGNAFRSQDGQGVQFTFSDGIDPNSNSQVLIVRTNAQNFSPAGSAGILGNGVGTTTAATVIAPSASVAVAVAPEPGTVALVGMGLMGTAGMVLRRRKA